MGNHVNRKRIWELMAANSMKRVDLQRSTGLSQSTIDRILDKADYSPNFKSISAIARVFGVRFSELVQD